MQTSSNNGGDRTNLSRTFKYLMATQFLSRGIPFIFNSWIVRHLTEADYAIYAVQFHLFVTCVLFLSHEGFRRACMRAEFKCVSGFACLLELLAEPLYILAQYLFCLKLRMVVESTATLACCLTTYVLIARKGGLQNAIVFGLSLWRLHFLRLLGLLSFPSWIARFTALPFQTEPRVTPVKSSALLPTSHMASSNGFRYLFDGFTSTFQDKLFKGYNMEIHNQIFYTTLCSCVLSLTGLILQGQLLTAVDFVYRHKDCLYDIALLSTVATASQFFISYTIQTFGALTFATIMTTRQLLSILLSCLWFAHPPSPLQMVGAVIVFGTLYAKAFLRNNTPKLPPADVQDQESIPLKEGP